MTAAFDQIHPGGCPANLDLLPTHEAGGDSCAIRARVAVGPRCVRLRQRGRMAPELSRFCGLQVPDQACTVVGALALRAVLPPAVFR